jgi:hypothetical protein
MNKTISEHVTTEDYVAFEKFLYLARCCVSITKGSEGGWSFRLHGYWEGVRLTYNVTAKRYVEAWEKMVSLCRDYINEVKHLK